MSTEQEARERAERLVKEWTEEVGLTEDEALDGNTIELLVSDITRALLGKE